jgi:mono/diheme cytochrome c family protein
MLRTLARVIIGLLALVGAGALLVVAWFASQGISTRSEPGPRETAIARRLRSMAVPAAARNQANPVPASAEAIRQGMEHFADHCAVCHANDGSGDTEMGRGMYPRAPDMREAATQGLSDGELFYIIQNGVRLTGMPAWGGEGEHDAGDNWRLVHFIRHLPKLTDQERAAMKALNPKAPDEWQQDEQERQFLEGGAPEDKKAPAPHTHGHGRGDTK